MKKLLHIVLYLPYGGLEKIVYDFSVALNGKGYEVHVAALQEGGPMQGQLERAGIPVHVFGKRPGKIDLKLLFKLVKLIRKFDIDVIHSHSGCIMYAALAGRLAGVKKIIHTEHGKYFPEPKLRILEDRIFSYLITKFVCVSKQLEQYVSATTKISKRKIETIINGIDTSNFYRYSDKVRSRLRDENEIPRNSFVVGTVCRLIRAKNVNFLIEWIAKYGELYEDIVLVIVGDGPQFDEWYKIAKDVAKGRVKFFGSREDVADLLNIFDVFALVSTTEGTSLTILEAMATELPVIVSDVGGNGHLVRHGQSGYLFAVDDLDGFNFYLSAVISDSLYAKKIGRCARKIVQEKFSMYNVFEQYQQIYS